MQLAATCIFGEKQNGSEGIRMEWMPAPRPATSRRYPTRRTPRPIPSVTDVAAPSATPHLGV